MHTCKRHVCRPACIYAHTHAWCMHACMHIACIWKQACKHAYMRKHARMHSWMQHTHAFMRACMQACIVACLQACTNARKHATCMQQMHCLQPKIEAVCHHVFLMLCLSPHAFPPFLFAFLGGTRLHAAATGSWLHTLVNYALLQEPKVNLTYFWVLDNLLVL